MFEPPVVGDDVLDVRPHAPTYLARLPPARVLVPAILICLAVAALRADSVIGAVVAVAGTITVVASLLGLLALHFRTTYLRVTRGRIELRGPLVRDRDIDVRASAALLASVPQYNAGIAPMLMVRPVRGRSLCVNGTYWNSGDLLEVARRIGATVIDEPCTPAEVQRMLPGSLPLMYRRPVLWGFGIVAGVLLALTVVLTVAVLVLG
ncbi:hypothetical protein [Ilumatobacter nonamiensis]|uniref:hypothetical protein n=1 Tax=Ilumatobacter nonamiensis TaxID=467093 RepID=UPI000349367C|nr:hypothetical protein [Ilumatobacter nonamiensis]